MTEPNPLVPSIDPSEIEPEQLEKEIQSIRLRSVRAHLQASPTGEIQDTLARQILADMAKTANDQCRRQVDSESTEGVRQLASAINNAVSNVSANPFEINPNTPVDRTPELPTIELVPGETDTTLTVPGEDE